MSTLTTDLSTHFDDNQIYRLLMGGNEVIVSKGEPLMRYLYILASNVLKPTEPYDPNQGITPDGNTVKQYPTSYSSLGQPETFGDKPIARIFEVVPS